MSDLNISITRVIENVPSCPNCLDTQHVREILYGLPVEPVDKSKYVIGGCHIWEGMPLYRCLRCNWESDELVPAPKGIECWYCGQSEGLKQINFIITGASEYNRFVWEGIELIPDPYPIYRCQKCGWSGRLEN